MIELLGAVIVLLVGYYYYRQKLVEDKLGWIPEAPGRKLFVGHALDFAKSTITLDTLMRYSKECDGFCVVSIGNRKLIIINDYKFLEYLLPSTKILNKSREYSFLGKWLGNGLLTSPATRWRKSRKIYSPAFHFSILEQFVPVFEANGQILVDLLEKEVGIDSVDIYPYITMCTLDIICETAMGVSINAQKYPHSEYIFAVKEMCRITVDRGFSAITRFDLLYKLFPDYYKEKKYVETLHSHTNSVMESKRKELENNQTHKNKSNSIEEDLGVKRKLAFLDLLLESTMDGKPLPDEFIREEVDTFMFEGHDTTAAGTCFTLFSLAEYPEVQAKALEEQKLIFGEDICRTATHRDLQEMKYLELVIKESLRLYPSVPFISRESDVDIEYKDGKIIPKNTALLIFIYGMNRNPKFHPNPDKFDPTRFENMDGSSPYSYIPFSAGPRNCIGQKYAIVELKSVISKVLRNYELLPAVPKHKVILAAETVLKSANGIRIKFKKRQYT